MLKSINGGELVVVTLEARNYIIALTAQKRPSYGLDLRAITHTQKTASL